MRSLTRYRCPGMSCDQADGRRMFPRTKLGTPLGSGTVSWSRSDGSLRWTGRAAARTVGRDASQSCSSAATVSRATMRCTARETELLRRLWRSFKITALAATTTVSAKVDCWYSSPREPTFDRISYCLEKTLDPGQDMPTPEPLPSPVEAALTQGAYFAASRHSERAAPSSTRRPSLSTSYGSGPRTKPGRACVIPRDGTIPAGGSSNIIQFPQR